MVGMTSISFCTRSSDIFLVHDVSSIDTQTVKKNLIRLNLLKLSRCPSLPSHGSLSTGIHQNLTLALCSLGYETIFVLRHVFT